jgi:hypothetical protein
VQRRPAAGARIGTTLAQSARRAATAAWHRGKAAI